jgi:hypothetical protein
MNAADSVLKICGHQRLHDLSQRDLIDVGDELEGVVRWA